MEEDDRFGFLVKLCQISDSQEEELRCLPFTDSSNHPQSPTQVQPPQSETEPLAPPPLAALGAADATLLGDFPTPALEEIEQCFAADNAAGRETPDASRRGEGAIPELDRRGIQLESVAEVIARLAKREVGESSRACGEIRVSGKSKFVVQYLNKLKEVQKQYEENLPARRSRVTPTGVEEVPFACDNVVRYLNKLKEMQKRYEEVMAFKLAVENTAFKDSPEAGGGVPIACDNVVRKTSASEEVGISSEMRSKKLKLSDVNVV